MMFGGDFLSCKTIQERKLDRSVLGILDEMVLCYLQKNDF